MRTHTTHNQTNGGTRAPKQLSGTLERNLVAYAVAAAAAGMGLTAQSARAEVVYTPAHIPIRPNGPLVYLDLNNDGVNDFQFKNVFRSESGYSNKLTFSAAPVGASNGIMGYPCFVECASALPTREPVGPSGAFANSNAFLVYSYYVCSGGIKTGAWWEKTQAYLGLKIVFNGETHYGWARVQAGRNQDGYHPRITGYAYETIPNKPLTTGAMKSDAMDDREEPSALPEFGKPGHSDLGILALGLKHRKGC
jgi:hypothetical protein